MPRSSRGTACSESEPGIDPIVPEDKKFPAGPRPFRLIFVSRANPRFPEIPPQFANNIIAIARSDGRFLTDVENQELFDGIFVEDWVCPPRQSDFSRLEHDPR